MKNLLQSFCISLYGFCKKLGIFSGPRGQAFFRLLYRPYKRYLEARNIVLLKPYVTPGSIAIDIGANIGFFTAYFADWVGASGQVVAFEPEASNYQALVTSLRKTGIDNRVEAVQAAVSDHSGKDRLQINPVHPGDHRLGAEGVLVDVVTLDDYLSDEDAARVSMIKIDVQGAEEKVLAGTQCILNKFKPPLFVEIDESALRQQGSSLDGLLSRLLIHGYQPYVLMRQGPVPVASKDGIRARLKTDGYADILFLPPSDS